MFCPNEPFFLTACFASLRSILVVEYLGLEQLTNCFGLFLLFQGLGALLGNPIAGEFLICYTRVISLLNSHEGTVRMTLGIWHSAYLSRKGQWSVGAKHYASCFQSDVNHCIICHGIYAGICLKH